MNRYIRLSGSVLVQENISQEDFMKAFVTFCEENKWEFMGSVSEQDADFPEEKCGLLLSEKDALLLRNILIEILSEEDDFLDDEWNDAVNFLQ